jgi:hypothetical protein
MLLVLTAALILQSAIAPSTARADEIIANNSSTASCSSSTTPPCYTTIQAAIDAASAATGTTYTVRVEPGAYQENITLKGITVRGRETARTIVFGSGTLVTAGTSSSAGSISNLTFANASIGIDATNNTASFEIKNNIFMGLATAVKLQGSSNTTISNNVFYANGTAISTDEDRVIKNNIFLSNTTMAISTIATVANITYNDFFSNAADGVVWETTTNIADDPSFVAAAAATPDFHLQSGSPCINTGSGAVDLGAYGGPDTDTIPFMVSGVTTSLDTTTNDVTVSWTANPDYKVIGYRVYYGKTSGGPYDGTGAVDGSSPISLTTGTADSTYVLSGLTSTVSAPGTPTDLQSSPLNESLDLSWSPAEGATSYMVYWSTSSFDISSLPTDSTEVDQTSQRLTGLTNGTPYYIGVAAVAEASYYVAVTAIYATSDTDPGVSNESWYSSEATTGIGGSMTGALSAVITDYPEALVAYPNLESKGPRCFIATAAFGYYSAPEVRALREFRDRYLLTNSAGAAFVRWYYGHGPVAAAYIDAHPAYKPVVRAALMPAVGIALFMTKTPFFIRAVVALFFLMIALMIAHHLFRKKLSGSGGAL